MPVLTWKPEKRKVSDLKELPNNPRRIKGEAFEKLKQRISARGFHDVVKVDTEGYILSGNQRRRALIDLGITEVYALTPSRELTKEERDKVILESNRNDGEWDFDILGNEFDLKDLLDVGFEEKDLDIDLTAPQDDEVPEVPEEPKSKLGDLYLLGSHRVLCGDSTKIEDVERLMNGKKADLTFTSPPYNADAKAGDGDIFTSKKSKKLYADGYSDNLPSDEYVKFAQDVLYLCFSFTDGFIFWNVSYNKNSRYQYIQQITPYLEHLIEQIAWKKSSAIPFKGSMRRVWEPIYLFSTAKVTLGLDQVETNVWEVSNTDSQAENHKACYPVALVVKGIQLIKNSKSVLDPFLGSGSTLIAAEKTGRTCYGMELDPKYVDVIVKRWEDFTGKKAELIRE